MNETTSPGGAGRDRRTDGARAGSRALLWVLVVAGVALLAAAAATFSYRGYFGASAQQASAPAPAAEPATPVAEPIAELDYSDLERALRAVSEGQRERLLQDPEAFKAFVTQEARRRAVLRAARETGIAAEPNVVYLMERGAQQVLVEAYMAANVRGRMPPDFPDEAKLEEIYASNRSRYEVEERVPIWQVFVTVPADGSEVEAQQSATEIVEQLRAGSLTFAEAATRYSAHDPSRGREGFMGEVRPSQLLPALRDAVLALPAGEVSDPIRGEAGVHIVRRGAVVPARVVPLQEVRDTLRDEVRKAAVQQLRQAVIAKTVEAYGAAPLAAQTLADWRARLQESSLASETPP